MTDLTQVWPRPSRPRPIAIIGAGAIVRTAHLPVYRRLGFPVAGVYDVNWATAQKAAAQFGVERVFRSLEEACALDGVIYDLAVPGTAYFTGASFFGALYPVYLRGLAYYRMGRHREAVAAYQRAIQLDARLAREGTTSVARAYARMGDDRHQKIQQRAYEIWEREGRPWGREAEFWDRAAAELAALMKLPRAAAKAAPKAPSITASAKPAKAKAPAKPKADDKVIVDPPKARATRGKAKA